MRKFRKAEELMERLWCLEAMMKYPKQWIVMVNIINEPETHKAIGDVYMVTSSENEAYETAIILGNNMGEATVVEGFDDAPQIGGLEL